MNNEPTFSNRIGQGIARASLFGIEWNGRKKDFGYDQHLTGKPKAIDVIGHTFWIHVLWH